MQTQNQINAQSSTGPKTEAGKARSSQNARKHGLSTKTLHVPAGREPEFFELHQALFDEFRPVNETQSLYFDQLVHAAWNITIGRELLVNALTADDDKRINTANRYIAQYERTYARVHKTLSENMTDLALRAIPENEPIAALPAVVRAKTIAAEATSLARLEKPDNRANYRMLTLLHIAEAFTPPPAQEQQTAQETAAQQTPQHVPQQAA